MALTPDCMHWVFLLVSMYTNCIWNKYNYLQKHKLFTDEFHYLKWIMKCTEIVYIMVSYIQSEEWKYWFYNLHNPPPTKYFDIIINPLYSKQLLNLVLFSINRLIMMSVWRHNAPNFTGKKIVYITIKLVNCFYSMSNIIF